MREDLFLFETLEAVTREIQAIMDYGLAVKVSLERVEGRGGKDDAPFYSLTVYTPR